MAGKLEGFAMDLEFAGRVRLRSGFPEWFAGGRWTLAKCSPFAAGPSRTASDNTHSGGSKWMTPKSVGGYWNGKLDTSER